MNFFKKKHSVCADCGVHFEPVTGYEARWGQFCGIHRKEHRERDEKKDAVLRWADKNWIRLHDQMVAEYQTEIEQQNNYCSSALKAQQNEAIRQNSHLSATQLFNIFGGQI